MQSARTREQTTNAIPGWELATERRAFGVTARQVATRLGLSRQRVSSIEATARVPAPTAERYLSALRAAFDAQPLEARA